jgi:hypothetical protein
MRLAPLALGLVTIGCGGGVAPEAPDPVRDYIQALQDGAAPSEDFQVPCLGRVYGAIPASALAVAKNVMLARTILDDRGILSNEDFCAVFSGTKVYLVALDVLWSGYPADYTLQTHGWLMRLSRKGGLYLLHELLHKLDVSRGGRGADPHAGWDTDGWLSASAEFEGSYFPMWAE